MTERPCNKIVLKKEKNLDNKGRGGGRSRLAYLVNHLLVDLPPPPPPNRGGAPGFRKAGPGPYAQYLRAHDHYTSSTLIGENGKAGPRSLHTMLEGPTEYVNARWMQSLHGFLHGIKWIMFHGHVEYFQKPPLGAKPNTKLGDHNTPDPHND
jgi:hypothetical protein